MATPTVAAVIASLEAGLALFAALDPNASATAAEIAQLTDVASKVLVSVSTLSGMPIADVVAGLTYEDPNVVTPEPPAPGA